MTESTVREAEAPTLAAEQLGLVADRTRLRQRRRAGASPSLLLLLALLAAAAAPAARAGLERICTLSNFYEARRHSARTSCSRQLPERLRAICRGPIHIPGGANYGQPMRHRRDVAAEALDAGAAEVAPLVGGGDDGVFLDRRTASAYLHKRQVEEGGGIQGIVCECCIYPCKRREMSQYCANGGAGTSRKRRRASTDVAESESDNADSKPLVAAAAASFNAAADDATQSSSPSVGSASSGNVAA